MKSYLIYVCLFMFGCGRAETKPIRLFVDDLKLAPVKLTDGVEILSFGSLSIAYGLELNFDSGKVSKRRLKGGTLERDAFYANGSSTYEDVTDLGSHQVWEDSSSCRCDDVRPQSIMTIVKPIVTICSPGLLNKDNMDFQGEISQNLCASQEISDYDSMSVSEGSHLSSELTLNFTDSFVAGHPSSQTPLCFKKGTESICLNAFKASIKTTIQ